VKIRVSHLVAAGLLSATLSVSAFAQNIAVVNGVPIPMAQYDQILTMIQKNSPTKPVTDEVKARLKKELISRAVLMQAAESAGITKSPDYQNDLDSAKQSIAINLFMKSKMDALKVTDEAAKADYDKYVIANSGKEYKADHILVPTEKEAISIIAKLNKDKGANFAALAKQYSKDPGSAATGGSLGWASPNNYVKPFSEALELLKKGTYTQTPVKTQFGYHIIKLEDSRKATLPKFDDVKTQIVQQIKQREMTQLQENLVKSAKVE
jgi:peptidyl-prolyl cis-trans isomerase C